MLHDVALDRFLMVLLGLKGEVKNQGDDKYDKNHAFRYICVLVFAKLIQLAIGVLHVPLESLDGFVHGVDAHQVLLNVFSKGSRFCFYLLHSSVQSG